MKPAPSGFWRSVRWLFVLLLAAGVAFAAQDNWIASLHVGEKSIAEWLERLPFDERPTADIALPETPSRSQESNYSMNRWLDTTLFSRPSSGWTFDSSKIMNRSTTQAQSTAAAPPTVEASSAFPVAFFSNGFVMSAPSPTGPIPADPTGGPTTTGIWISNASGNWGTSTNWQNGTIPQGNTARARFDLLNITTDVTVTNESPRTIGFVDIGDTNATNHYNITGAALTFENLFDGVATIQQIATSAGDTISAPMLLTDDLRIRNFSANVLTLSGSITANAAPPSSATITFEQGNVNVTGNMSNGSGTALGVSVDGGLVTLSGTNSYTRQTFVNAGTLLINGDNSAATGPVLVTGEGTLGGIGKIGGDVEMFGNSRITGGTTTSVGTLTMLGNVFMVDGENGGGTYVANLLGSTSDLLAITGNLTLGRGSFLTIDGTADGTTTYILATYTGGGLSGMFDSVTGLPADYTLVYTSSDIELVPTAIPEPATWMGSVLALGAIAFAMRRKLQTHLGWIARSAAR